MLAGPARVRHPSIVADIDATASPDPSGPDSTRAAARRPQVVRQVVAVILVVLTALLSLVSVLAGYVRSDLLDTEKYVEIVAPLAREPAVQAEVVDAVTQTVIDNVRLDDLVQDAIAVLEAGDSRLAELLRSDGRLAEALNSSISAVGPLVQNQLEEATRRAATRIVESERFADLWTEANRVAQSKTLAALRDEGSVLRTDDGAVRVDVGVIVEEVKQRLVESGLTVANRIPSVSSEIVLVQSAELAKAQSALLIFDSLAPWLPWVTLVLAIAAVLVAIDRRRAVLQVAVAIAATMIILAIALAVGQAWLVGRVSATVEPAAAEAIMTAFLGPLWTRLWVVFGVAAVIAVVALLIGPLGANLRKRVMGRRQEATSAAP